jgi:hypothetical protein
MSSINRFNRWLTYRERVQEYHKLVRMVARAFYSARVDDIVVLDALLHLIETKDTPATHTVSDVDIRQLIHLPEKKISAVLTRLKQDHIVKMIQKDAEKKEEEGAFTHPHTPHSPTPPFSSLTHSPPGRVCS